MIDSIEARVDRIGEALRDASEATELLDRQVEEAVDRLSSRQEENSALRQNVTRLSTESESLAATREELSSELSRVISARDSVVKELEAQVAELATILGTTEEELGSALARNTALALDRDLSIERGAALDKELGALREVRAELGAQVSQLAALLEENHEKLSAARMESADLRERNQLLVVQLGAAKQALAKMEIESAALRDRNRVTVVHVDELEQALAQLRRDRTQLLEEYAALRDRAKELEARLSDETERTTLVQREIEDREIRLSEVRLALEQSDEELTKQRRVSARAQAQIALLNQQIAALRQQLARISRALDAAEAEAEEQMVVIANLGRRLNLALAGKVEELQRYRSEFFGRLREVLGNRPGILIEGDRFVIQSEVLFASGSAELGEEGRRQMGQLAETLLDIAREIPGEINWILRVDGHTDKVPIVTAQFPSNWELSTARAISVVHSLTDRGVPAERLAATGFGEFQPLDPRDDEIAFRRNRRIELKLTQK